VKGRHDDPGIPPRGVRAARGSRCGLPGRERLRPLWCRSKVRCLRAPNRLTGRAGRNGWVQGLRGGPHRAGQAPPTQRGDPPDALYQTVMGRGLDDWPNVVHSHNLGTANLGANARQRAPLRPPPPRPWELPQPGGRGGAGRAGQVGAGGPRLVAYARAPRFRGAGRTAVISRVSVGRAPRTAGVYPTWTPKGGSSVIHNGRGPPSGCTGARSRYRRPGAPGIRPPPTPPCLSSAGSRAEGNHPPGLEGRR